MPFVSSLHPRSGVRFAAGGLARRLAHPLPQRMAQGSQKKPPPLAHAGVPHQRHGLPVRPRPALGHRWQTALERSGLRVSRLSEYDEDQLIVPLAQSPIPDRLMTTLAWSMR